MPPKNQMKYRVFYIRQLKISSNFHQLNVLALRNYAIGSALSSHSVPLSQTWYDTKEDYGFWEKLK